MGRRQRAIQAADARFDEATGALVVLNIPSAAQETFDLLEFPLWHTEDLEDITWDVRFALAALDDPLFEGPIISGDTSVSVTNLLARIDYKGVPGAIEAVTGDGIATKLSEADSMLRSGTLFVPLLETALKHLVPGKKYIRRSAQKARGHDEWSVSHDEIIVW